MVMKKRSIILRLFICSMLILITQHDASAGVELKTFKTLKMDEVPIDMAITSDGRSLFVLTEDGNVIIYDAGGTPTDKVAVGRRFDQIKVAPGDRVLILGSQETQSVQLMTISSIQEINVAGSPFKGPEDAPVVIVAFDDFQ